MDFWISRLCGFGGAFDMCCWCFDDGGKYGNCGCFEWMSTFLRVIVWYKSNGCASTVCNADDDGSGCDLNVVDMESIDGGTRCLCSVGPLTLFSMRISGVRSYACGTLPPYVCLSICSIGPSWNVYVDVTDDLIGLNFGTYTFGSFGILYCVMCCVNFVSGMILILSSSIVGIKLSLTANLFGNLRSSNCNASIAFWFASSVVNLWSVSCPIADVPSCFIS